MEDFSMAKVNEEEFDTDYEVGQDNVEVMGLDLHNPVFFISAVSILFFVIGTICFQRRPMKLWAALKAG